MRNLEEPLVSEIPYASVAPARWVAKSLLLHTFTQDAVVRSLGIAARMSQTFRFRVSASFDNHGTRPRGAEKPMSIHKDSRVLSHLAIGVAVGMLSGCASPQETPVPEPDTVESQPDPRRQPEASVTVYSPDQHDLYDGHFVISASRLYMVGALDDPDGWDHLDNAGTTVHEIEGTVEFDVNDIENTGTFEARLTIPEGDLVLTLDRVHEFSPCQDGGIAAYLHEHGADSGCGDGNWPKTFVFVAGWGYGHATLNGQPLYDDYEMHFMVTQGIRDRDSLRVNHPTAATSPAGQVNPATQQMDFYIRSPEVNEANTPGRDVFAHFFGMEVTWK